MKALLAALTVCLLLLAPQAGRAAGEGFSEGERGDAVLRAQLRLSDLGFSNADPSGLWRAADAQAMAAFIEAGGAAGSLFSQDGPRAKTGAETPAQDVMAVGGAMPWSEARTRLDVGESYALTDCHTGIVIRLSYLGGENHAEMQPVLSWDDATMAALFTGASPLDARPVVLSIDGMLAAASMRLCPLAQTEGLTRVQLYFTGSGAGLGGLADAEHMEALKLAVAAQ